VAASDRRSGSCSQHSTRPTVCLGQAQTVKGDKNHVRNKKAAQILASDYVSMPKLRKIVRSRRQCSAMSQLPIQRQKQSHNFAYGRRRRSSRVAVLSRFLRRRLAFYHAQERQNGRFQTRPHPLQPGLFLLYLTCDLSDQRHNTTMKILLVEDDDLVSDSLSRALRSTGYIVDCAADGEHATTAVSTEPYDLIILDLGLPKLDGLKFLTRIRSKKINTPVLILTARDSYDERIKGLDCGANDYVSKPFHLGELEARIRALLRISCHNATEVVIGELTFDTTKRVLRRGEELIDLSPREYSTLEILIHNVGSLVTKQKMAALLSDLDTEVTYNALDIVIHRLRKKLEPFGLKLQTIRGLGYIVES
jgi:two-component system, OmpR family, response regulator